MIFILPGMGTNNAMYEGPWREMEDCRFINWPKLDGDTTLPEIAEMVIEKNSIGPEDWVGGSSMGGMVSLEISKVLGNPQVVLIGSAKSTREISQVLFNLARFSDLTPIVFLQTISGSTPLKFGKVFANSDPDFIRKAIKALRSWEGGESTPAKILRMHGSRDLIIPCPNEGHIIQGAGHLVAMTHAEECVAILRRMIGEGEGLDLETN
ncbi:MAG: hypothetical protein H6752_18355 [Candidatus Omnitrophica bacterium]|nr:hypothetical protein [Candidatus Omnitrophota bacterium]